MVQVARTIRNRYVRIPSSPPAGKFSCARDISEEKLVVTIDKKQEIYLQNDPVNINELGSKIREKLLDPTRQSVYLRADQTVPFQTFASVLDHLKLAGIENVSIVTQPIQQSKK